MERNKKSIKRMDKFGMCYSFWILKCFFFYVYIFTSITTRTTKKFAAAGGREFLLTCGYDNSDCDEIHENNVEKEFNETQKMDS